MWKDTPGPNNCGIFSLLVIHLDIPQSAVPLPLPCQHESEQLVKKRMNQGGTVNSFFLWNFWELAALQLPAHGSGTD